MPIPSDKPVPYHSHLLGLDDNAPWAEQTTPEGLSLFDPAGRPSITRAEQRSRLRGADGVGDSPRRAALHFVLPVRRGLQCAHWAVLGRNSAQRHAGPVTPGPNFEIRRGPNDPDAVARLLRLLPDWFGIEESVLQYIEDAETKPTYLAVDREADTVLGALLITRHNARSAELHLLLVDPAFHRRGVGRSLVDTATDDLRADGVELLEVKTQGPSMPDENYAGTTRFYEAMGFIPMEELIGLWPSNPCLILVKPL